MKTAWAVSGVLIGAALLALPPEAVRAQAEAPGASVVVARATTACFTDVIRVTGVIVPRRMAVVNVDSEGFKLTEVLAAEGNQVSTGQVIAHLSRPAAPANPAIPGPAGAARPAATMTLRSPADGLVMRSTARVGAMASPQGEPLFSVLVDNEVEMEVEIPGIHVTKLKAGVTARVTVGTAVDRPGRVRHVYPDINEKTQLGRARLTVGSDSSFRVGLFGRATIDARRNCSAVSIPRSAVDYRTEGTMVQVVRGRTVETRRVVIGILADDTAEILEGVVDGDMVVAHSGTSLHDGDRINPIRSGDADQMRSLR
jgi:multidrug efflux pump subunit AcrA (membrane-fusion protein)